ncbi:hypothetical protein ATSB10_03610 [Dyella thiooxydans]|uniref:Uncharacterized protein n=1 Tax=Dyella thiooxydans TaxID=445710 RepID=A0A161JWZ5_9GAMM|nr:hypothetical protein ATSB10_03610 [Dyella thiooxydans]
MSAGIGIDNPSDGAVNRWGVESAAGDAVGGLPWHPASKAKLAVIRLRRFIGGSQVCGDGPALRMKAAPAARRRGVDVP